MLPNHLRNQRYRPEVELTGDALAVADDDMAAPQSLVHIHTEQARIGRLAEGAADRNLHGLGT